ncbi:MAG: isoleucine--tRNA ligase [bacterium]|nr:isoleucine--tRNA ligase [bacterium]
MREVSPRVVSDELEREVLIFWDENKIFEKSLEQHKNDTLFTFYDGPPYATGKPHYGHILISAIKDTVLRYKTMKGYYVPRRVGWDTHGLPIENIVEKELGITSKKQIEDDIEGFNKKCRETVYLYVDMFRDTLKRIGRWAEYGNEYSTLDRDYMESEWWVFQQLWNQELIYKSFRTTPYCTRCATPLSNFEVGMAYKEVKDMTVYVALRGTNNQQLIIWTTTPWTLPGNVAVAFNPEILYVVAKKETREYILAKDRVQNVLGDDAEIIREVSVAELSQMTYEPLYESALTEEEKQKSFRLVPSGHVTATDGTGLVHMAPAFGEADHEVAKKAGLPILRIIDTLGNFMPEVPNWAGRNIFDSQKAIMKDLDTRGLLFKRELVTHSYPFCWRCDTPLIYFALDSWFLKVSELKDAMQSSNQDISWVPEHVKEGRFGKGIESAPDWAISRNRFWSVPMPIWECDACEERACVGSVAQLQELSGASDEQVKDIHRPYVDDIFWKHAGCEGVMRRISEVLDVWFDSGSMPYAQYHYPFENKELVEKGYPADFITESIEMTRAWFYVLHVLATALTKEDVGLGKNKPAFSHAVASGLIFAEDGRKLSKKLKNYPEIEPTLKSYGADVLRFYLLSSSTLGEPYKFSEKDMRQIQRNVYMTLWNVYSMYTRYALVHAFGGGSVGESSNSLDRWIISRTNQLISEVTMHTDAYRIDSASRLFIAYIDDLSNWYIRRSRGRLQHPKDDAERDEVFGTLHSVLVTVSKLLAPFMPFVSENMYGNLTDEESVHLSVYPLPQSFDQNILESMQRVRDAVSQGLSLRAEAKIKVRQKLQAFMVTHTGFSAEDIAMIQEEVNVNEVVVSDEISLNTNITPALKQEGIARDIIRFGQSLRKQALYALDDRIVVGIQTDNVEIFEVLRLHKEMISEALQTDAIDDVLEDADVSEEVQLDGARVIIAVKKG